MTRPLFDGPPSHDASSVEEIGVAPLGLKALLRRPDDARGLVVFVHGSGSGRHSPRNAFVAEALDGEGFATLLFDLLTPDEETDRRNVFDIPLLSERLISTIGWIDRQPRLAALPLGLFGASTGAAAALVAASWLGERVGAVVSRGGRPDLAAAGLEKVRAPTLLIVGGNDPDVLSLNRAALARLGCEKSLKIVPGAGHLFAEPGALEAVVEMAAAWFSDHLAARHQQEE